MQMFGVSRCSWKKIVLRAGSEVSMLQRNPDRQVNVPMEKRHAIHGDGKISIGNTSTSGMYICVCI